MNGAFGAGKTAAAAALRPALPGAIAFDPEVIGSLIRRVAPVPTGDYQDLRSWRRLVVGAALTLDIVRPGPVVVPMTLLRERSTSEILGVLRALGRDVRHVLLDVTGDDLRRRIADAPARGAVEEGTRAWRQAHMAEYERQRARLVDCADLVVDTAGRSPEEIAASLVAHLAG